MKADKLFEKTLKYFYWDELNKTITPCYYWRFKKENPSLFRIIIREFFYYSYRLRLRIASWIMGSDIEEWHGY